MIFLLFSAREQNWQQDSVRVEKIIRTKPEFQRGFEPQPSLPINFDKCREDPDADFTSKVFFLMEKVTEVVSARILFLKVEQFSVRQLLSHSVSSWGCS